MPVSRRPPRFCSGLYGAYISKRFKFSRVRLRKDLGESTSSALGSGRAGRRGGARGGRGRRPGPRRPRQQEGVPCGRALCPLPTLPASASLTSVSVSLRPRVKARSRLDGAGACSSHQLLHFLLLLGGESEGVSYCSQKCSALAVLSAESVYFFLFARWRFYFFSPYYSQVYNLRSRSAS